MIALPHFRPAFFGVGMDADAAAYIAAVEAADGQSLETATKQAIANFIEGCKDDNIWDAIKASCILAGARTLAGALVPLRGTAPTNFNFVSSDYDRKTGLIGNGSTKYLNTNRNNNADPQNSKHIAAYRKRAPTGTTGGIGAGALVGNTINQNGASWLFDQVGTSSDAIRVNQSPSIININYGTGETFVGASRSNSSSISMRFGGTTTTASTTSQTPSNEDLYVFNFSTAKSSAHISYYSIGEAIDLAKLDSRISTLMSDFNSAIP
jgi:hypothetical protein